MKLRARATQRALAGCLCLVAALTSCCTLLEAQQYGGGSSLAPTYESELLAAAYQHQSGGGGGGGGGGAHHPPQSYGEQMQEPCVLTIKPYNATTQASYSAALAANTDSSSSQHHHQHQHQHQHHQSTYLTNYVSSGRREPYRHKGRSICITQRDVNYAVEEAKASLGGYVPKEIYTANSETPKPMQVTVVAEIITQATRILANKFKLPEPAILYDLPAIDLGKSAAIDKICPVFLKPGVHCDHSQAHYRTLTGYCNNLQYQSWGSSRSAMVRFLAPDYYDSISLPRRAYDGSPLPSARVVSFVVHQDPQEYDRYHSMFGVVWGQFLNHDVNLAVRASDENPSTEQVDCCKSEDAHPDCFPIEIPKGDPFYGYFQQKCMHFTRASSGLQPGCSLGPIQPQNKQSAYIDASTVYGFGIKTLNRLRTFHGGQLRSQPVSSALAYGSTSGASSTSEYAGEPPVIAAPGDHSPHLAGAASSGHSASASADYLVASGSRQHQEQRQLNGLDVAASNSAYSSEAHGSSDAGGHHHYAPAAAGAHKPLKELMPANKYAPDVGCERRGRPKDVYCFDSGDSRANEQIQLATMHTLWMREHNRLAKELSYINAHWDDERLFQEARKIVIAQIQHISFNEFLPLVIGKEKIYEYGLELEAPGKYYYGYDSKINAGVRVEFQAAAFRYGHSLIPATISRYNKYHQKIESIRLSKLLKQPYDLYHPGVLDTYILGLADQRSGRMDPTLTTEVANHLFEKPGKFFGLDLAAINIQRGRENGIAGYNHYREYCGMPRAKYFEDLTGVFSNKTLLRLAQLYKHVDDIDLFTAGISEYPVHDGLVGPTFACLISRQFVNLRRGDRLWYENAGYPAQFTIEQLDEIRKQTAARLMCDNSDDIYDIQASAMLVAEPYTNPRVPCSSLPYIDLAKWREQTVAYGPAAPAPQQQHQQHQHPAASGYGGEEPAHPSYGAGASAEDASLAAAALEYEHQQAAQHHHQHQQAAAAAASGNSEEYPSRPLVETYQPALEMSEPSDEYEPAKRTTTTTHFVDHVVESAGPDYREPEGPAHPLPPAEGYSAAGAAAA